MRSLIAFVLAASGCAPDVRVQALKAIDGAAVVHLLERSDAMPTPSTLALVAPDGPRWQVDTTPWSPVGDWTTSLVATEDRVVALMRDETMLLAGVDSERLLAPWPHRLEAFARADGRTLWRADLPPLNRAKHVSVADEQLVVRVGAEVVVMGDPSVDAHELSRLVVASFALADGAPGFTLEIAEPGQMRALFGGSALAAVMQAATGRRPAGLDRVVVADGRVVRDRAATAVACQSGDALMFQGLDGLYVASLAAPTAARRLAPSDGELMQCGRRGDGWVVVESTGFRLPGHARRVRDDGAVQWKVALGLDPYSTFPPSAVRAELGPRLPLVLRGEDYGFVLTWLDAETGVGSALEDGRVVWVTDTGHGIIDAESPDVTGNGADPRAQHAHGGLWWVFWREPVAHDALAFMVVPLTDATRVTYSH